MKIIIIGGLYEGLGLATALKLASFGNEVIIIHKAETSRDNKEVEILEEKLSILCDKYALRLSVMRYESSSALSKILQYHANTVNSVIHCECQRAYDFTKAIDVDIKSINKAIENEISSIVAIANFIFPHWKEKGSGSLISFGYHYDYWNNLLPFHGGHLYGDDGNLFKLAKATKNELMKCYSDKYYQFGIRTNTIEPGNILNLKIPELENLIFNNNKNNDGAVNSLDVANVAIFLVSNESRFVSGSSIPVLNKPIKWKVNG